MSEKKNTKKGSASVRRFTELHGKVFLGWICIEQTAPSIFTHH